MNLTSRNSIARLGFLFVWTIDLATTDHDRLTKERIIKYRECDGFTHITRRCYHSSFSLEWQYTHEFFVRQMSSCHMYGWCYITVSTEYNCLVIIIHDCSFEYIKSHIHISLFLFECRIFESLRTHNSIQWIKYFMFNSREIFGYRCIVPVDNPDSEAAHHSHECIMPLYFECIPFW